MSKLYAYSRRQKVTTKYLDTDIMSPLNVIDSPALGIGYSLGIRITHTITIRRL